MSQGLKCLFNELLDLEHKPLTRQSLGRIKRIKENYIKIYKNLPIKTFQVYFDDYISFLDLYRKIKSYKVVQTTIQVVVPQQRRRSEQFQIKFPLYTTFQFRDDSELKVRFPIVIRVMDINFLYKRRPLALKWYDMATFDFNIAFKLNNLTSTKVKDIEQFLSLLKIYHDALRAEDRATLIAFVCSAKILEEAKVRFGSIVPETYAELETILFTNVLSLETEEELLKRINNAKQGKRNLKDFAAYLADLANRLGAVMMRTNPALQRVTVQATCSKLALTQFKSFCHDEVKLVLAAARPATLDDALAVATASNLDGAPNAQNGVFAFQGNSNNRKKNYSNGNRNFNFNRQNSNWNANRSNSRGGSGNYNQSSNYNQNTQYRNNSNYNQNRNFNPNPGQHRNNNNNNYNNNRGTNQGNNRGYNNNFNNQQNNRGNGFNQRNNWSRNVNTAETENQQQQASNVHTMNGQGN